LLVRAAKDLHDWFQIHHTTLQFETPDHECSLAREEKVWLRSCLGLTAFRATGEEPVAVCRITCLHFQPPTRHTAETLMGSLKKRRKAKISKHKRRKRMRENRHKKRLRYKA